MNLQAFVRSLTSQESSGLKIHNLVLALVVRGWAELSAGAASIPSFRP